MLVYGGGIGYGDKIATITGTNTFTIVDSGHNGTARTTGTSGSNVPLVFGALLMSNGGIFSTNPAGLTVNEPVVINNDHRRTRR